MESSIDLITPLMVLMMFIFYMIPLIICWTILHGFFTHKDNDLKTKIIAGGIMVFVSFIPGMNIGMLFILLSHRNG